MNLYDALTARLDASMTGPYPREVVNGEMSMNEYRENIKKIYKGKYDRPERRWKNKPDEQAPAGAAVGPTTAEEYLKGIGEQ